MNNNKHIISGSYKPRRWIKQLLLDENPHCFYCGKKCVDYGMIPVGQNNPHNMATIDHLKSRYFRKKGELVEKVLSCYRCNQQRAIDENAKYGKSFQQLTLDSA